MTVMGRDILTRDFHHCSGHITVVLQDVSGDLCVPAVLFHKLYQSAAFYCQKAKQGPSFLVAGVNPEYEAAEKNIHKPRCSSHHHCHSVTEMVYFKDRERQIELQLSIFLKWSQCATELLYSPACEIL